MGKLNVAELLKDCPKDMELDCLIYEDVYFDYVDELNIIHCYIQHETHKTSLTFNQYGTPNSDIKSKCVIFPKGKTTWEGFIPPCKFKDGDILFHKHKSNNIKYIFIYKRRIDKHYLLNYCGWFSEKPLVSEQFNVTERVLLYENDDIRFATEEEKEKLFNAIKAKGYRWNAETKTLDKLIIPKFKVGDVIQDMDTYKVKITEVNIEDECYEYESMIAKGIGGIPFREQDNWELVLNKFDITTLVPFDKVLVRDSDKDMWCASIFSHTWKDKYFCAGVWYNQCIPYEGNEKLLGTTNDCDEYYKTWE